MQLSRRHLLTGAAALAGAGALGIGRSATATAAPVPAGGDAITTADRVAADGYRLLVPEIFRDVPPAPDHTDVVVIGSGFGGATAALRLAQAGVRVAVLDRGSRWPRSRWRAIHSDEVIPDGRALWHRRTFTNVSTLEHTVPRFGGVLDVTDHDALQVWRAAAVGGGSVVFAGVLLEPQQRHFEAVFGDTLRYDEMHAQWYPLARRMLRASPMPADVYGSLPFGHSRVWDDAVRRAGYPSAPLDGIWDWDVVRDELWGRARRSACNGESNFGNANGAKRDLTLGYLRDAEATGRASVHPGHAVTRIGERPGGGYTVDVEVLTPLGEVVTRRTITCDRLVLGAGSVGTTELLVRARAEGTLTRLDDSVGEGFGTNGDAALIMAGLPSTGLWQGAPSASTILDESSGTPVRLESWYSVGFTLNLGLACSLGMVLEDTRGSFRYDPARDAVVIDYPADGTARTKEALRPVHERLLAATGARDGVSVVGAPGIQTHFTAHPLGGAVLGRALDGFGRVRGHDGLYVLDGAAIPGSTGTANPSLTITALAERNVAEIIRARG